MDRVDFGVVYNSETCRFHLNNFKDHDCKEWGMYSDPTFFLKFVHPRNVAVLHWPYPSDPNFGPMVDSIYAACEKIFIMISEVHRPAIEFMQTYDREKIVYYIAGSLDVPLQHATLCQYHDWFHTTRFFYREYLPELLHRIDYTSVKPHAFDILLGRKKPHRDFAYTYATRNLRGRDYFLRYFNNNEPILYEDEDHWTFEQRGVVSDGPKKWTVDTIEYYGHRMSMSQVLPVEVYNNTAYTLVAETNYDNFFTFFTEKTAKPIIARRLFIMIAGAGYLKELRRMGFKTFDSIIDESYDTIESNVDRWDAAMRQVEWLCQQDQAEILEKVRPIVEHNFEVMMQQRDWYGEFNRDLESRVAQVLPQIESLPDS